MTPDTPRAPDAPLVDPETGETPPLSPQSTRTPEYAELLILVVDPAKRIAYTDGTWGPDDAA